MKTLTTIVLLMTAGLAQAWEWPWNWDIFIPLTATDYAHDYVHTLKSSASEAIKQKAFQKLVELYESGKLDAWEYIDSDGGDDEENTESYGEKSSFPQDNSSWKQINPNSYDLILVLESDASDEAKAKAFQMLTDLYDSGQIETWVYALCLANVQCSNANEAIKKQALQKLVGLGDSGIIKIECYAEYLVSILECDASEHIKEQVVGELFLIYKQGPAAYQKEMTGDAADEL